MQVCPTILSPEAGANIMQIDKTFEQVREEYAGLLGCEPSHVVPSVLRSAAAAMGVTFTLTFGGLVEGERFTMTGAHYVKSEGQRAFGSTASCTRMASCETDDSRIVTRGWV